MDIDIRIVPANGALAIRGVVVGALVDDQRRFAEHEETVGEARRHPKLAVVFPVETLAGPLAEVWRVPADVDGKVVLYEGLVDARRFKPCTS